MLNKIIKIKNTPYGYEASCAVMKEYGHYVYLGYGETREGALFFLLKQLEHEAF